MSYIIVTRNTRTGKLAVLLDENNNNIKEFENYGESCEVAEKVFEDKPCDILRVSGR